MDFLCVNLKAKNIFLNSVCSIYMNFNPFRTIRKDLEWIWQGFGKDLERIWQESGKDLARI